MSTARIARLNPVTGEVPSVARSSGGWPASSDIFRSASSVATALIVAALNEGALSQTPSHRSLAVASGIHAGIWTSFQASPESGAASWIKMIQLSFGLRSENLKLPAATVCAARNRSNDSLKYQRAHLFRTS